MNVVGKIIALWGILVLAAWSITQFVTINYFNTGYTESALILWTVAMAAALAVTYKYMPGAMGNKVVKLWTAITVIGMVLCYVNFVKFLPVVGPYVYFHAWLALTAIGFGLTAMWWTPKSRMIYMAGAALNVVLLALMFANVGPVVAYSLFLAGIVGGLPPILDGMLNYNIPKPAAAASSPSAPAALAPSVPGPTNPASAAPRTPVAPVKIKVTIK